MTGPPRPHDHQYNKFSGVLQSSVGSTPSCFSVALPASGYKTGFPKAAPLRAEVGYSIQGAVIYGPFDAGFTAGGTPNGAGWKESPGFG